METITEKHNWTQCRDQQILGNPARMESSMAQRTSQKVVLKYQKSHNTRKSFVLQHLPEMAAKQDPNSDNANGHIDVEEEVFLQTKTYRQLMITRRAS